MSTGVQNPGFTSATSQKVSLIYYGDTGACDEGSYYTATNTPGTAIATTTSVVDDATGATTHAQQKPVMWVANSGQAGAGTAAPTIYLRYLKMNIVQVPTSASSWKYAMRLTPNISSKITTAGTLITPQQPNSNTSMGSRALIQFGAITATDSTLDLGQRLVAAGQVHGGLPVALDEWLFNFGGPAVGFDTNGTVTNVKRLSIPCPPIIIAPGWGWVLEMYGASNAAAPSWEFEMGWIERPFGQ
jgi:hypothetical protein